MKETDDLNIVSESIDFLMSHQCLTQNMPEEQSFEVIQNYIIDPEKVQASIPLYILPDTEQKIEENDEDEQTFDSDELKSEDPSSTGLNPRNSAVNPSRQEAGTDFGSRSGEESGDKPDETTDIALSEALAYNGVAGKDFTVTQFLAPTDPSVQKIISKLNLIPPHQSQNKL